VKRVFRLGMVALMVGIFAITSPASAQVICNTYTYTGDDDSAFAANLPYTLKLGLTEYENVYVSTNGTLTFGRADGTYWDYPQTPSVSVAGYDWVTFGQGAYLSFGSTENTFCAEWSVRPFPQSTGELTQIRLVINKYPNGTWHGEIVTFGWTPDNLRRGIRFEQGQPVVPIEAAFDVGDSGIPVEVPPAPTPPSFTEPPTIPSESPTPEVTPEPTILPSPTEIPSPTPTPEPTLEPVPTPEPTPTPSPSEAVIEPPVASPIPEPSPTPVFTPTPTPTPVAPDLVPDLVPEPVQESVQVLTYEDFLASGLDYEDLPPDTPVTLENGVILTAEVADAIEIFDTPAELLSTIFSDPGKALKALRNVGADMTEEDREIAQNTVVAAVIVTQIAQVRRIK
jgi:hypothetical protein